MNKFFKFVYLRKKVDYYYFSQIFNIVSRIEFFFEFYRIILIFYISIRSANQFFIIMKNRFHEIHFQKFQKLYLKMIIRKFFLRVYDNKNSFFKKNLKSFFQSYIFNIF